MSHSKVDVLLLHPPNVYDFRKMTIFYGPISDVVPSTPIYEMYPIGFLSLTTFLENRGYRVRIVNLAARMLRDRSFDVEHYLRKLEADLYGIDLHWLVHAHGAIEIAKLVKKHRPDAPVVMGGFSATYFHRELVQHPCVDFVLRGDTTEGPFLKLLEALERGGDFGEIPNLTWKRGGRIHVNPLTFVPTELDEYAIDYRVVQKSAKREGALEDYTPFVHFYESPIGAALTAKGCLYNCTFCGGSNFAYRCVFNRMRIGLKSPDAVIEEIKSLLELARIPIFVLGDPMLGGRRRAFRFFELVRRELGDASLIFELYRPADSEFLRALASCCNEPYIQISPNTQDEAVRARYGMPYSNKSLEQVVESALQAGVGRFDLYFMIGLSGQTFESCLGIAGYVDRLFAKFAKYRGKLNAFISPLAPFLDVGSLAFERGLGYKVLFRGLGSFRRALTMPSWKYSLSYETDCLTRDQIVDATYIAAKQFAEVKAKHGIMSEKDAEDLKHRIELAQRLMKKIDTIVAEEGFASEKLSELRGVALEEVEGTSLIGTKRELWPQLGRFRALLLKFRALLQLV